MVLDQRGAALGSSSRYGDGPLPLSGQLCRNAGQRRLNEMKVKRAVQLGVICVGLLLAIVASPGSAYANGKDPGGGGTPSCTPQTYMYQSGSYVYFNGWTYCQSISSYRITIAYGRDGTTNYASTQCWPGPGQVTCGINGLTRALYNPSGSQHWCMVTILDVMGPFGKNQHLYSLGECHWY
jgi:hypothetical protein